jgi:hypothetical protein
MHGQVVAQAGSMLPEFLASPHAGIALRALAITAAD